MTAFLGNLRKKKIENCDLEKPYIHCGLLIEIDQKYDRIGI